MPTKTLFFAFFVDENGWQVNVHITVDKIDMLKLANKNVQLVSPRSKDAWIQKEICQRKWIREGVE